MHTHIHTIGDPLHEYIKTTNMEGLILLDLSEKTQRITKQDISVQDCLWTPYLNYAIFPNLEQLIYIYHEYHNNPYDITLLNPDFDLQKSLNYKFNHNYSRFDLYSDMMLYPEIPRATISIIQTAQPTIERFQSWIPENSIIKEENNYERMLITNIKHSVKIYTCIRENSKHLELAIFTNSINPEFLIRAALLSTLLINKYICKIQFETKLVNQLNAILEDAKNNPKRSLNTIYNIMYEAFDLANFAQNKKKQLIEALNTQYKTQLTDTLKNTLRNIEQQIQDCYKQTIQWTKEKRETLLKLNGFEQETYSNPFNILIDSPAIIAIDQNQKTKNRLILTLIFRVPLNNIDYAQFKRQYNHVQDRAGMYYNNHHKELKALFLDRSYTLIVQQPVNLILDETIITVSVNQHDLSKLHIQVNGGYPYNPHLERYNCWGDSMAQIAKYTTVNQLDDLIPVISASVSNLNVGDSTVMEKFIEQLAYLKEISETEKNQTRCILKNETKELITYKQFLEEINKGDANA